MAGIERDPRKRKLTEAAGTNPSKMGGVSLDSGPSMAPPKPGAGYAQDSAPHKTIQSAFSVGGPGFPKPIK